MLFQQTLETGYWMWWWLIQGVYCSLYAAVLFSHIYIV